MGVYSLEAAEYLAAKKLAINESLTPYENPVFEYGIKSIRADFALFEAQLELDFKEYYDIVNEAKTKDKPQPTQSDPNSGSQNGEAQSNQSDSNGSTMVVKVPNGRPKPGDAAKDRNAMRNQIKKEEKQDQADAAKKAASNKSRLNQALGKFKIDSGTIGKFVDTIKRIWANLVSSLTNMFHHLVIAFNKFSDKNGEKFSAAVAKIKNGEADGYNGKDINIIPPAMVKSVFDKIIARCYALLKNSDNMEIEKVKIEIDQIDEDLKNSLAEMNKPVNFKYAKQIIISNANILNDNTFKEGAKQAYNKLIQAANEKVNNANINYNKKVREVGQQEVDKDPSLQIAKEKAQKLSQLAGRVGSEYGKAVTASIGTVIRATFGIVAYANGKSVTSKVDKTKQAMEEKAAKKKNPEKPVPVNVMSNRPSPENNNGAESVRNNANDDIKALLKAKQQAKDAGDKAKMEEIDKLLRAALSNQSKGSKYSSLNVKESYSFDEEDLFTLEETADILQVMVEDTCDINFDECFDF